MKLADKAHLLGPAEEQPYQNIAKLIDIARTSGADAIHPGIDRKARRDKSL